MADDAASEPRVYPDAFERVNAFIQQFAVDVDSPLEPLDTHGYAELRCDGLALGLNVDAERGILLMVATIGQLPEEASGELLRYLLELNLLSTGVSSFALDRDSEALLLRVMSPVHSLGYLQFSEMLQSLADVATTMHQHLATG